MWFLMEMFFLSYVSDTMYLLWNLPFFKMVPPKTNFCFLKPWVDNGSTNQDSCQLFYGWGMIHLVHIVGEGPGETPSALRCLSYLINSFLTNIKNPAKNQQGGTLSVPFWCLCQKLSLPLAFPIPISMRVRSLGGEKSLEKGIATHSSLLAWRIPWTEEPGVTESDPTEQLTLSLHFRHTSK